MAPALRFREIDTERDGAIAVAFRADSFVVSFGSDAGFFAQAGPNGERYLEKLRLRNRELPGSCVHAWRDDEIVGQIEVRRVPEDPSCAHVGLYYLRADLRGTGLGDELDQYVRDLVRDAGFDFARLRVSPTNTRALAYYRKHGWQDRGADPDHANVHVMERPINATRVGA
jgi:ribosomal protein S18 acetylase RimI-like enzyme